MAAIAGSGTGSRDTRTSRADWESAGRSWSLLDWSHRDDYVEDMVRGSESLDGIVLVVSACEGVASRTRQELLLAHRAGVQSLVIFVNKVDLIEDDELRGLVGTEIRELLSQCGYSADLVPLVFGSALKVLEGDTSQDGGEAVKRLLRCMGNAIEQGRVTDGPFLMSIQDSFGIPTKAASPANRLREAFAALGPGTLVTGRIERGVVEPGAEVAVIGFGSQQVGTVAGVATPFEVGSRGVAGESASVLLRGVEYEGVERGQVLARPGSVASHTAFEAEVYVMRPDESGQSVTFSNSGKRVGYFYFRSAEVLGDITGLRQGDIEVDYAEGGSYAMTVRLARPVALEEGLRFSVREGGRAVGSGLVTRIVGPLPA
ncbi:GTP-binding protein [Streptomyces cinnamoneus]|uniref:Elongation factor Tu n=1 Tax=Streptomyces cinnamoneus TaxID=53446 RepID=A0A918TRR7_STRCJ|nr:GTP-binding protein [Streptomyces cinnamoneus]GHC53882.1 elongation factor Tu [Streptomyces cinnamoneus]